MEGDVEWLFGVVPELGWVSVMSARSTAFAEEAGVDVFVTECSHAEGRWRMVSWASS